MVYCQSTPQIDLHTNLEERLPYWFMKRVDQVSIREFPNRCFRGKVRQHDNDNNMLRFQKAMQL